MAMRSVKNSPCLESMAGRKDSGQPVGGFMSAFESLSKTVPSLSETALAGGRRPTYAWDVGLKRMLRRIYTLPVFVNLGRPLFRMSRYGALEWPSLGLARSFAALVQWTHGRRVQATAEDPGADHGGERREKEADDPLDPLACLFGVFLISEAIPTSSSARKARSCASRTTG